MISTTMDDDKSRLFQFYQKARNAAGRILLDDRQYAELSYHVIFGRPLDLDNPQTFHEKIQWIKLYYRHPQMTSLSDKYLAKDLIRKQVGDKHLPLTFAVFDSVDALQEQLPQLPRRFVLKATHGCGWNLFVEDKNHLSAADFSRMRRWLSLNYYHHVREWSYKDIVPRLICEEFVDADDPALGLVEYRYYCFHGRPQFILALIDHIGRAELSFYDNDWQLALFKYSTAKPPTIIPRPETHDLMIEMAQTLSAGWPFLRVDFLSTAVPKVGELTFYPAGGYGYFDPPSYDYHFGQLIDLTSLDTRDLPDPN